MTTTAADRTVTTPPPPQDVTPSALPIFLRSVWALIWPILIAVVLVIIGWVVFLKAFDVAPVVGKSPLAVWRYLFTDPGAGDNRTVVFDLLRTTLHDASLGFVGGMVAALVVAALFVMFRSIEQAFMPIALLLRSVPLVAMTPIILLIFKRGDGGVAVIGGIVVFFPALVNIAYGLRSASRTSTDVVLAYGGNRWTVIRKVAIPTALPAIFASARISVPGALIGALVAEWLATGKGIGGGILNAIGAFDYGQVWADIVVLTGVSLLLYTVVGVIETAVLTAYGPNAGRR